MKFLKAVACLAAIVAALGLVACGGDDDTTTSAETTAETTEQPSGDTGATGSEGATGSDGAAAGESSTLQVEADPGGALAYAETDLSVAAGNVTVEFTNDAPVPHDVVFSEPGGEAGGEQIGGTDVISEDSTSTELSDLKPGTYAFWCTVPGHLEAGMEGTLTVE